MIRKIAILSLFFIWAVTPLASAAFFLPDTGQDQCYDGSNIVDCSGTGQDGAYSINPMSYTDNKDGTVTDNNTGLMWQKCSAGQDGDTCNSGSATTLTWAQAQDACGSLTRGTILTGGFPRRRLMGIVDYGVSYPGPTIDTTYFPNTVAGSSSHYWTSLSYGGNPDVSNAWYVTFDYGSVYNQDKGTAYYVRCVRGEEADEQFKDNGNGTVTDNLTGLVWQKTESKDGTKPWADAISYCEGLSLGGHTDWRLPNVKELESLTDDNRLNPAINALFHLGSTVKRHWTSTSLASDPTYAWYVSFYDGTAVSFEGGSIKSNSSTYYYRCVRAGNSPSLLSVTKSGTGSGTVISSPEGINCGSHCTQGFAFGSQVTLTPSPDSGSVFTGWSGDCQGTGTCTVAMTGTKSVGADFESGQCTYTITPKNKTWTYKGGTVTINVKASGYSLSGGRCQQQSGLGHRDRYAHYQEQTDHKAHHTRTRHFHKEERDPLYRGEYVHVGPECRSLHHEAQLLRFHAVLQKRRDGIVQRDRNPCGLHVDRGSECQIRMGACNLLKQQRGGLLGGCQYRDCGEERHHHRDA